MAFYNSTWQTAAILFGILDAPVYLDNDFRLILPYLDACHVTVKYTNGHLCLPGVHSGKSYIVAAGTVAVFIGYPINKSLE